MTQGLCVTADEHMVFMATLSDDEVYFASH